jgi:hypothetical protein
MDRTEFEALRDLPGKKITQDLRFRRVAAVRPNVVAEDLVIQNSAGTELRLTVHYNPERGSKTFNVHVPGGSPICRLDVDGPPHRPAGESHKHSCQGPLDPNLRDGVIDRPDLSGKPLEELFATFCQMAQIEFTGAIELPSEAES